MMCSAHKMDAAAKAGYATSSDEFQMLVRARAGQTQERVHATCVDVIDGVLGCANIL